MIDFSISMPRRRALAKARPVTWDSDYSAQRISRIELRTANLRGAYREIIAAEDDGLPIDVREAGGFLDTRLTIVLTNLPTERDHVAFFRLSQKLARFGPIALKPDPA